MANDKFSMTNFQFRPGVFVAHFREVSATDFTDKKFLLSAFQVSCSSFPSGVVRKKGDGSE
jgi:hypothetical protein